MSKLSREDRQALLNSVVYKELESLTKTAQSLSDKIIQSPVAQKAISDGISKALENKDDDGEMEEVHNTIKDGIKKLTDHELFEMSKFFTDELKDRGLDTAEYKKEFKEEEAEETPEDEMDEEQDMEDVFAFVKGNLIKIANNCADNGNTESAYLIERFLDKLK